MPAGTAAPLPPGFVGCVPAEKAGTGQRALRHSGTLRITLTSANNYQGLSDMYIAAMIFDAMIFIFTFGRAVHMRLNNTTVPILEIIFRDGTLYFTSV
jgi:uncharacterized membrane protein (UPF0127 family)